MVGLLVGIGLLALAIRLAMVAWTLRHMGAGLGSPVGGLMLWGIVVFVIGMMMAGFGGMA